MNRREFLQYGSLAPLFTVTASGLLLPNQSEAFVPMLLRLILGHLIKGIVRVVSSNTARTMVKVADLGLKTASVLAVSSQVAQAYEKHNATRLWIAGSDAKHDIKVLAAGDDDEYATAYINYRVTDLKTGKQEKIGTPRLIATKPNSEISFDFKVSNLPYTGAKLVEGLASLDPEGKVPNKRFLVPKKQIVYVADPNEVATNIT